MCRAFFRGPRARAYVQAVDRLLVAQTEIPILYMNFKSHNILDPHARAKMFDLVRRYNPATLCLSEALVPNALAHATHPRKRTLPVVDLRDLRDDTITQPHEACRAFDKKKRQEYGGQPKSVSGEWRPFFVSIGMRYAIFASPAQCPFGSNWGNVILSKRPVVAARSVHLPSHGKTSFGAKESRCAVWVDLGVRATHADREAPDSVMSTHLDDLNDTRDIRAKQTRKLVQSLRRRPAAIPRLTLCGDLNSLHQPSYSKREWETLERLAHPPGSALRTDAVQLLSASGVFAAARPLNNNKFESLFQKCVTHVFSNRFQHALMQLSDATEFDHQPIFVW